MRVFTARLINHLEQIEATVFPPFDILQVDGDAAHLAHCDDQREGEARGSKSDTSTGQLSKECSESYRRLGPDPCDDVSQLKAVKVPRHRNK